MELNYFDLVVGIIVLLLGLKGIINGFFKELFGLIGIIGGIFVATRVGDSVGEMLSDMVFKFESQAPISFTGFLVTFALFWISMILAGMLFKKLSKASGLGPVDKIFGFIIGSGKFFLIGAVIVFSLYNIRVIRDNLEPAMENSIMFPILVETGRVIMKIDPVEAASDINETLGESLEEGVEKSDTLVETAKEKIIITTEKIEESAVKAVKQKSEALIDEVKDQIEQNLSK